MQCRHTRRQWLSSTAGALSGAWLAGSPLARAAQAPTAPVAVSRCKTYNSSELLPALESMFDQLGGLGRLVKGKTVAMKINLTGAPTYRIGYLPLEDTHYTNPYVIGAVAHLMGKAGARRIRILESPWSTAGIRPESLLRRLRCLCESRQNEGACHGGNHAFHEELLRPDARHHLRRRSRCG